MKKMMYVTFIYLIVHTVISNDSGTAYAEDRVMEGGHVVSVYPEDAVSLDPAGADDLASYQRIYVIYDTLFHLNIRLEPEEMLASDYKQTNDTTWQIDLRNDVVFHDGTELNAEAVKASFDRLLDPAMDSPGAGNFDVIESVKVIDDYTVEFVTEHPVESLPHYLTHVSGAILSNELIEEDYQNALDEAGLNMTVEEYYEVRELDDESFEETAEEIKGYLGDIAEQNPVGTSYMTFKSWEPGEKIITEKNYDYWGSRLPINSMEFKVIPDEDERFIDYTVGNSQLIHGYDLKNWSLIDISEDVNLYLNEVLSFEYIGFNTQKEYLNEKSVRQAIAYMVDEEKIIEEAYYDIGRRMTGLLREGMTGYDEDFEDFEYDPERAQALMTESGYESGFELTMLISDEVKEHESAAAYLRDELEKINIDLNIEVFESEVYLEALNNGDYDMFIEEWKNPVADPDTGMYPLFHSSNAGSDSNWTFFENEDVDKLLEDGKTETDSDKRAKIYQELEEILMDEQPVISFRRPLSDVSFRTGVYSFNINPNELPQFSGMHITDRKQLEE